jgi:tetratricopeptide (TPR) repeat protein
MSYRELLLVLTTLSVLAVSPNAVIPQPAQGKVVSLHGRVEHTPAASENWRAADIFQNLFVRDQVRTFVASRAAILFIDETQVKLSADAILTVHAVKVGAAVVPSTLELHKGKGWFRTKNPKSGLTITTAGNGKARLTGTEINVEIRPGDETVLTVIEGTVEFSNDQGSLLVNAGEEATARPGVAPTKRIVLNPEDAVQWSLYYPTSFPLHDILQAVGNSPARIGFEHLKQRDARGALNIFTPLLGTDGWARIGASMAHKELGDLEQARQVLIASGEGRNGKLEHDQKLNNELHTQLAVIALAAGDPNTARAEIDTALAIDSRSLRALTLLSVFELTQNKKENARSAADSALVAHPNSVAANIVAGEVAQAYFDLDKAHKYLDKALEIDPDEVHALVNRARIRFGSGDTRAAKKDAEQAASIAPNDAQVRSLAGFIKLAEGDLDGAGSDFDSAIKSDTELGEPHLGLGLLRLRQGKINEGLLEMLTATLLEPKISLYQSYLGKAYHLLKRYEEGLAVLETAKRLDPHDPTPWLYTSIFMRDLNRYVDALNELGQAVKRNDNRAVYRSSFLLDRDLVAKSLNIARLYHRLGFEVWGVSEALKSLNSDITNASGHLFLGNAYSDMEDFAFTQSSEFLQYHLYTPVGENPSISFNEYTALLDQLRVQQKFHRSYQLTGDPAASDVNARFENNVSASEENKRFDYVLREPSLIQLTAFAGGGTGHLGFGNVEARSGNERFAYSLFSHYQREIVRPDRPNKLIQGLGQTKVSLGANTDMYVRLDGIDDKRGAMEEKILEYEIHNDAGSMMESLSSPGFKQNTDFSNGILGFKHNWRTGSVLTAALQASNLKSLIEYPSLFTTWSVTGGTAIRRDVKLKETFGNRFYDTQIQQVTRLARHQIIVGAEGFWEYEKYESATTLSDPLWRPYSAKAHDRDFSAWLRDEIAVSSYLHVSIGMRYQNIKIKRLADDPYFNTTLHIKKLNPLLGISLQLSDNMVLRTGAFRRLSTNFSGAGISPTTVAGFLLDRDELPTTDRMELGVSLEHSARRTFLQVQGFYREVKVPLLKTGFTLGADRELKASGGIFYLNHILTKHWSLFADYRFVRTKTVPAQRAGERAEAPPFFREENRIRVGLNFAHQSGFLVRLTNSYATLRHLHSISEKFNDSSYNLTGLGFNYRFADKRGLAFLAITNLFSWRISYNDGSYFIDFLNQPRTERHATLGLGWSF